MKSIKGAIIMRSFYQRRHENGQGMMFRYLFERIQRYTGFPLVYTDSPDLRGLDVALIFATPYHNSPELPAGILKSKAKIICFYGDLPCYGNKLCIKNKRRIFERSDVIMGGFRERFLEWYPEFAYKYAFFPGHYFPYERYEKLKTNMRPLMNCLLSGANNVRYPLRSYIKKYCVENPNKTTRRIHIRKKGHSSHMEYASFINKYFCGIATSGIHNCVVAKYYEYPAAGVLLLAEKVKELDMLGFEPDIHYLPITKETVFIQVDRALAHPEDFTEMRVQARALVRKYHSDINRAYQFKLIVERLMG